MIEKVGVTDAGCTVYRIGSKYWICPQYVYITFPNNRVMIRLRYFKGTELITKSVSKTSPDVSWVMEQLTVFCKELEKQGILRLLKTQHTLTIPIIETKHHHHHRYVINIPRALKRDFGHCAHSRSFSTLEERSLELRKMTTRRNILEGVIRSRFCISTQQALQLHTNVPLARDCILTKGN